MTDDPDGDRSDGPSDGTSEEDPFVYPLADDDAEESPEDEESTGSDAASESGGEASAAGEDSSSSESGSSSGESGSDSAASRSSSSGSGGPDGSSGPSAGGAASSRGRSGSSGSGAASGSASGATGRGTGTRGAGSGGSGGSASGHRSARSNADSRATAGRHVTDRRPHASDSGPTRTSRGAAGGRGRSEAGERTAGAHATATETGPSGVVDWLRWFWTTDRVPAVYVRDVVTSVAAVLLVGLVLFGVSGVWPPMVAVESGSMEPNMQVGDLVFIIDNERYTPDEAQEYDDGTTGVVPADRATETGRSKFGGPGDVIVFKPNGNDATTPVIHRAMLWVEEGEDWYDRADPDAVGTAENCEQLNHCPAPHDGFVTRGDANPRYDQQTTLSEPVRPEWIVGTAELRIPFLGHIRLAFSWQIAPALDAGSGFDPTVAASDDSSSADGANGARIAADPATSSPRAGAAPASPGAVA